MKVALTLLVVCVAACVAYEQSGVPQQFVQRQFVQQSSVAQAPRVAKRQTTKPGRFLSLPVAQKCASRK